MPRPRPPRRAAGVSRRLHHPRPGLSPSTMPMCRLTVGRASAGALADLALRVPAAVPVVAELAVGDPIAPPPGGVHLLLGCRLDLFSRASLNALRGPGGGLDRGAPRAMQLHGNHVGASPRNRCAAGRRNRNTRGAAYASTTP